MNRLTCKRCGQTADHEDNFCRRCGHQLTVILPATPEPASKKPVVSEPANAIAPTLLGSMVVLAAGTGLEWLARRLAGNAGRAAARAMVGSAEKTRARKNTAVKTTTPNPDEVSVDEFVYIRKVQLRR